MQRKMYCLLIVVHHAPLPAPALASSWAIVSAVLRPWPSPAPSPPHTHNPSTPQSSIAHGGWVLGLHTPPPPYITPAQTKQTHEI